MYANIKTIAIVVFVLAFVIAVKLGLTFFNYEWFFKGGRWDRFDGGGVYGCAGPEISPDGQKIVYSSPYTGHGDIYVFDLIQRRHSRLTKSMHCEGMATWSPDGKAIVFIREDDEYDAHLWMMNADGSNQIQLSQDSHYDDSPCIGPGNDFVLFARQKGLKGYPTHLYRHDLESKNLEQLTNTSDVDTSPFVLNNQDFLYVHDTVDSSTIIRRNVQTQAEQTITKGHDPILIESTNTLYFLRQDEDFKIDIWTRDLTTGKEQKRTDTKAYISGLSYDPNSKSLYFLKHFSGKGIGTVCRYQNDKVEEIFDIQANKQK